MITRWWYSVKNMYLQYKNSYVAYQLNNNNTCLNTQMLVYFLYINCSALFLIPLPLQESDYDESNTIYCLNNNLDFSTEPIYRLQ